MTQDLKHLKVAILVEGSVELTELRTAGEAADGQTTGSIKR